MYGAQTDLKSVATCEEQVRVRFLYCPPDMDTDPKVGKPLGKRLVGSAGRVSITPVSAINKHTGWGSSFKSSWFESGSLVCFFMVLLARQVRKVNGEWAVGSDGYLTGLSNFRRCSKMVLTPVWKTGGWRKLAGVQFLLLLPYINILCSMFIYGYFFFKT